MSVNAYCEFWRVFRVSLGASRDERCTLRAARECVNDAQRAFSASSGAAAVKRAANADRRKLEKSFYLYRKWQAAVQMRANRTFQWPLFSIWLSAEGCLRYWFKEERRERGSPESIRFMSSLRCRTRIWTSDARLKTQIGAHARCTR